MGNFVLGKCVTLSADGYNSAAGYAPRSVSPKELTLLIGFAHKATCAITLTEASEMLRNKGIVHRVGT